MLKYIRLTLIATLLLAFASVAFAQDTIQVGETIEGEASDEITEYEIELEEGQAIVIEIEADWDTYLEIFDDNGSFLAGDDDGGDGFQSRLVFTADDSDTYVILVRAFGADTPEGDYELTVEEIEVEAVVDGGELEYDDDEDVELDNALAVEFTFEGAEGDTISIITFTEFYLNTEMELFDPQGDDIAESDAYYGDAILRFIDLPADGTYTIRIEGIDGTILDGELEIEVQLTEAQSLDDGSAEVEVGGNENQAFVFFTAEDDTMYELTIVTDDEPDFSELTIYVIEEGDSPDTYSEYRFGMTGGTGMSYIFESDDDGEYTVRVEYYGSDDIEVILSIEALETDDE
ncbi:MAG: hypothetical protein AAF846_24140 [Chloroflexota bacterium]